MSVSESAEKRSCWRRNTEVAHPKMRHVLAATLAATFAATLDHPACPSVFFSFSYAPTPTPPFLPSPLLLLLLLFLLPHSRSCLLLVGPLCILGTQQSTVLVHLLGLNRPAVLLAIWHSSSLKHLLVLLRFVLLHFLHLLLLLRLLRLSLLVHSLLLQLFPLFFSSSFSPRRS